MLIDEALAIARGYSPVTGSMDSYLFTVNGVDCSFVDRDGLASGFYSFCDRDTHDPGRQIHDSLPNMITYCQTRGGKSPGMAAPGLLSGLMGEIVALIAEHGDLPVALEVDGVPVRIRIGSKVFRIGADTTFHILLSPGDGYKISGALPPSRKEPVAPPEIDSQSPIFHTGRFQP